MVTPVHARLRVGGLLYGDALWSVGLNFAFDDGSDPFAQGVTDVQTVLQQWADGVKGLYGGGIVPTNIQQLLSSQAVINLIRCSRIGPDGKESALAEITVAPAKGGTGNPTQSVQTALVASLGTGRPGASYRGRMYWPALAVQLAGGGVSTPGPGDIATATASWLNDCADQLSTGLPTNPVRACVVSGTKGVCTPVTSVRVGNRLDSQRRRRGGENETYSSAVVPQ